MAVVTLTGNLGSMGDVASIVANGLGYTLAASELVLDAAAVLGWNQDRASALDERTGGFSRRLIELSGRWAAQQMSAATLLNPYCMPFAGALSTVRSEDEQYLEALTAVMNSVAERGSAVIVGHGGQMLLATHPSTVHVRIVCPSKERARRLAVREGVDPGEAYSRIEHSDTQREAWHRKHFGIDYRSSCHYSLVVNTGHMSDAFAAELIVQVVRARG